MDYGQLAYSLRHCRRLSAIGYETVAV